MPRCAGFKWLVWHVGELLVAAGLAPAQAHFGKGGVMGVASFDGHPAFHGRALVALGGAQQLPAPPFRPNLDLGGVLDQVSVLRLPRVGRHRLGQRMKSAAPEDGRFVG